MSPRARLHLLVAAAASLTWLPSGSARAADGVAVDYAVDPSCPDRAAFLASVHARTHRLLEGEPVVYRVRATTDATGARGTLAIVDPSGAAAERAVDGATCRDVVEALALVLALTIDPNASIEAATAPAAPEARSSPAERDAGFRSHLSASAGAELTLRVAPSALVGPTVAVDLAWQREGNRPRLEPALVVRLAATAARTSASVAGVGSADFTWTVGRLEVCPLRAALGPIDAAPCVRLDAGVLNAAGHVDDPRSASRPWLAAGALARVRWLVAGPVFVDVTGAVSAPLVHDHYYFDQPVANVYDVPGAGAAASVAAGLRFW